MKTFNTFDENWFYRVKSAIALKSANRARSVSIIHWLNLMKGLKFVVPYKASQFAEETSVTSRRRHLITKLAEKQR